MGTGWIRLSPITHKKAERLYSAPLFNYLPQLKLGGKRG